MTESFDCEGYTKGENKMDEYILKTAAMEIVRRTSGDYAAAFAAIRKLPADDVAPVVHGEWLLRHEGYGHYWECSSCHKSPRIYVTKDTRYCPNCGAKMDGKGEEA